MRGLERNIKLNILGIGILVSFLLFYVVYTLLARILSITVLLDLLDATNTALMILVISLFGISIGMSVFVSVLFSDDLPSRSVVLKSILMSFVLNFVLILGLSYVILYIVSPVLFSQVSGIEIFYVFPKVIIYFSIFLGHPLYLGVLSILIYYISFIFFLDHFSRR